MAEIIVIAALAKNNVIGKEGKIIQAIRNVVKILAIKEGKQIYIEVT